MVVVVRSGCRAFALVVDVVVVAGPQRGQGRSEGRATPRAGPQRGQRQDGEVAEAVQFWCDEVQFL